MKNYGKNHVLIMKNKNKYFKRYLVEKSSIVNFKTIKRNFNFIEKKLALILLKFRNFVMEVKKENHE